MLCCAIKYNQKIHGATEMVLKCESLILQKSWKLKNMLFTLKVSKSAGTVLLIFE